MHGSCVSFRSSRLDHCYNVCNLELPGSLADVTLEMEAEANAPNAAEYAEAPEARARARARETGFS